MVKCQPDIFMFAKSEEKLLKVQNLYHNNYAIFLNSLIHDHQVSIANGTLKYNLGYIHIIRKDSNTSSLMTIVAVIAVVIIATLFCIIISAVIILCTKNRHSR